MAEESIPTRNPEVAGGEQDVQQAANELEAATPQATPLVTDETNLPVGVDWQEQDAPLPDKFANEEEDILFGDPEGFGGNRPDSDVATATVPTHIARRLPALARAAADPGSPASLRAMYRLLADRLESELRGR